MDEQEEKLQQLRKAHNGIMGALVGLTNGEAIVRLETIKLDIMLNEGFVIIDGKVGLTEEEKLE